MNTDNIEVFGHNSIRVKSGDKNIYIDPFEMKISPKDADFILITHDHYDHFSPEDIGKVANGNTVMVVPKKMENKAKTVAGLVNEIVTVDPCDHRELDGKRIYIAGDTDETKEAMAVKCDIALVPVGGTYTMNTTKAAELVNLIRPEVAIPVHYGSIVGKSSDGDEFAKLVEPPVKVELKIAF